MSFLPPPCHGVLIAMAFLQAQTEHKGPKWCRKHGIGAARDILRDAAKAMSNVRLARMRPTDAALFPEALSQAEAVTASQCVRCGLCPKARE